MAFDLALDAHGEAWLLEVNSHCALGDGTMSAVDSQVYEGLVSDVVGLLVVPALEVHAAREGHEVRYHHAERESRQKFELLEWQDDDRSMAGTPIQS